MNDAHRGRSAGAEQMAVSSVAHIVGTDRLDSDESRIKQFTRQGRKSQLQFENRINFLLEFNGNFINGK